QKASFSYLHRVFLLLLDSDTAGETGVIRYSTGSSLSRGAISSNRSTNPQSIETIRKRIVLPSLILSAVRTAFATKASRQAAHSVADPRASSKNFALACPRRLPLPSAVLSRAERLARSS